MRIKCNGYEINVENGCFSVVKNNCLWVKLPACCAVDANGKKDVDEFDSKCISEEKNGKTVFTWHTASNIWERKTYTLEITDRWFLFRTSVRGNGTVDNVRYFNDPDRVRYEIGYYTLPLVNDYNKAMNGRMIVDSSIINIERAVPPMYVYPFRVEDEEGCLGLGVVAKAGNYNFDILKYDYPFQFTLPLYGHTSVDGEWEAQSVLGYFSDTEEQVLRDYTQWHFENGYAAPHGTYIPNWWREPIFCGWGEQLCCVQRNKDGYKVQHDACTQEFYNEMMRKLEKENLHPGSVIIDSKWQKGYGIWEPDEAKWPDLRAFVDEQHKKGIKVMMWLKAWDPEGLPEEECIHLLCNPVAADATNPDYIKRLKNMIYKLLSSDEGCYDCDGFKIDFLNCIPAGRDVVTYNGQYGVELIKTLMQEIYDASKAIKSDALISAFSAHPYFTELVDRTRNHDYRSELRTVKSIMEWRSAIYESANPDVPRDMDAGGIGSVRDFRRCMEYQAQRGVPSLYWLTKSGLEPLENVPFDDGDYDVIRKCWNEYSEKLKK